MITFWLKIIVCFLLFSFLLLGWSVLLGSALLLWILFLLREVGSCLCPTCFWVFLLYWIILWLKIPLLHFCIFLQQVCYWFCVQFWLFGKCQNDLEVFFGLFLLLIFLRWALLLQVDLLRNVVCCFHKSVQWVYSLVCVEDLLFRLSQWKLLLLFL